MAAAAADQLVRVVVETPRIIDAKQRRTFRRVCSMDGEDVHPMSKGFFEKVKELFGLRRRLRMKLRSWESFRFCTVSVTGFVRPRVCWGLVMIVRRCLSSGRRSSLLTP